MPKRTNDFQKLVTLVQRALAPNGAKITESHLVDVPGQSEPREIDILIETDVGPYRIRIAVEAKDEGRKLDSTKFEAIVGKYFLDGGVKVNKVVIVTHRGFYKPVIERARQLDVDLLTLKEASELDWSQFAPRAFHLESRRFVRDIKITPPIPSVPEQVVLRDGRVICSHGTNFGNPEKFAWHLFTRNVLRHKRDQIREFDQKARENPEGAMAKVEFKPDHEHILRLDDSDHPIEKFSFVVHLLPKEQGPPTAPTIRFIFRPHICGIELEPTIADVPLQQLRTDGRIVCKCCGKDHGTIREFAHRKMFEQFFPKNPQAVKMMEDGLRASPEGQLMLNTSWPLNHHVVRFGDEEYDVSSIRIGVHAISATAQLDCKQYELESSSGLKKVISHLEASVGGKKIRIVMPEGTKSEKVVLNIDSASNECC